MGHEVIYFPLEIYFSDGGHVCLMNPSESSQSGFVHRSQIASIGHICHQNIVNDIINIINPRWPAVRWLYRYVTRTNVAFFDLNTRLGLGSKNETFVRVT